ncbi:DUF7285 family protein [Haloarchaeobius amylolyticus]|uniref:DUF7285 family protein n=1 Tax=Haloarchaeobius amylolyticus TaxID=1198296 RepID=UPI002271902F|nr:hypothetical protein [Haloarchaeobius amylolyticus]
MSRWSMREQPAARRSNSRAQVEPTAALVAVFAVCVGLALFAGGLDATLARVGGDETGQRDLATPTLRQAHAAVAPDGVADPGRLTAAAGTGPDGYHVAVTLIAEGERWRVGPASPPHVSTAARPVSVRLEPGVVVSGTLRVEVWE